MVQYENLEAIDRTNSLARTLSKGSSFKPVLAKNLGKKESLMAKIMPQLAAVALILVVLASIGDFTVHSSKHHKARHGFSRSQALMGAHKGTGAVQSFEKYEFRLPKKVIPGSVLHILAPGLEEPQPVKIPMNAKGGELMSIDVPKQQLAGEEGEGEGEKKGQQKEEPVEEAEEAAQKVFVGTELGAKHYFLLILFIFGGSVIIFYSILGVVSGFGPLEVEGHLIIDHPCRFTIPETAEEARIALESLGDDVGGTPQSSPRKSLEQAPKSRPEGSPRESSTAQEVSPRQLGRRDSLRGGDMKQFKHQDTMRKTGEEKGLDALRAEGGHLSEGSPLPRAISSSPTLRTASAVVDEDKDPDTFELTSPAVLNEVLERGKWLLGLLILQSFASAILNHYEHLIRKHLVIAMFLTMLIGAGGNTGAQSVARIIQAFSAGNYESEYEIMWRAVRRQAPVALWLGVIMGWAAWARVWLSNGGLMQPTAIAISCAIIVFVSVFLGTIFPFMLACNGIDAMHSAALIQVTMDILGVLLTCVTCTLILGT